MCEKTEAGSQKLEVLMDKFSCYRQILRRELVLATGCTEPIAIAYAAALARETLGRRAGHLRALCSGNIVKNVKSVIVPGTGGLRGIEAAAIIGNVGGDAESGLNVLGWVTEEHRALTKQLLAEGMCEVALLDSRESLHIIVEAECGGHRASVEIRGTHTNVVSRKLDGVELAPQGQAASAAAEPEPEPDYEELSLEGILAYARGTELLDERELLERQISCNRAIAEEGLRGEYGLNVGRMLLEHGGAGEYSRAAAMAAAGSDARMGGCLMPVAINSGSGNQGLTVSMPVMTLAEAWGCGEERMLRALIISNLVSVHVKRHIGRLSAYCGATSASSGVAAAATWLRGGSDEQVYASVVNALAAVSGMVCDGAKASCAAKIASAVDAGLLGFYMYQNGQQFRGGDGIISKGVEETIRNIGLLATQGMRETDREILDIMTTRC